MHHDAITDRLELECEERAALGLTSSQVGGGGYDVSGEYSLSYTLPRLERQVYIRVRGTSTPDAEPAMDPTGENPWLDLWFYSNPMFIEIR